MRTTIDNGGRVVIPKALRDELGLTSGTSLEVTLKNGSIEIAPIMTGTRIAERGGVFVAEAETPLPPLTADEVREVLERVRR
jgi:AbrB family looped-hinge helix DNA binding protein